MHFTELGTIKQNKALYPALSPYLSPLDDYLKELITASPEPRYIVPPLVAKRLSINEALALALLMLPHKVGLIEPQYVVYCTEKGTVIGHYASLQDVPEEVFCPFHGEEHDSEEYYVELKFKFTPEALEQYAPAASRDTRNIRPPAEMNESYKSPYENTHPPAEKNESHKSPLEKARELTKEAEKATDPALRKFYLDAIGEFQLPPGYTIKINPDGTIVIEPIPKPEPTKAIFLCLLFYIVIFVTAFFSFSKLGFLVGAGVVIGTYALATLMMGVILVLRGDVPGGNFLDIVREGFKALNLLGKTKANNE